MYEAAADTPPNLLIINQGQLLWQGGEGGGMKMKNYFVYSLFMNNYELFLCSFELFNRQTFLK